MKRMTFEPEHELFRDSARRFFTNEIGIHSARWQQQGYVDRDAWLKAGAQGYLLMWADEAYGGAGIKDLRFEQIVHEENIRSGEVGFYTGLHSMIVAPYIDRIGTAEQKQRWLAPAVRGEKILAIAMTEPSAGSDLAGTKTRAEDRGDHWLLNGSKTYISNGLISDLIIVAAHTDPNRQHSMGLFVVERDMPGFERGKKLAKMGQHAQDTAELFFDNVKIPKENVLGDTGRGFHNMAQFLPTERLFAAVGSMAAAQTAFDITLQWVKERRAFGKPIGAFQNTRFKMADLRAQLDMAQTFLDQCVILANTEELTTEVASEAKMLASDLEGRVMDECVQLHGGAGYMEEYRICRMYTDSRITRIFAGTNEIMKEIIGRGLGLDERKMN
jgi:alkylation response protein AidB-like acyl-CoA dehydrogenase